MGVAGMSGSGPHSLHSAAAIRTRARIGSWRGASVIDAGCLCNGFWFANDLICCKQAAAEAKIFGAPANGEEAVVADAMEAVWQDMEQKAADELSGVEGHELGLAVAPIILPGEADFAIVG